MTQLIEFYREEGLDCEGRTFEELLAMSDREWELGHDFIQWLFPLREASAFNADAPLLTDEDVAAFRSDSFLCYQLQRAFCRFLTFLGLGIEDDRVVKAENFELRRPIWNRLNHNWLRITRALRSLKVLGLESECCKFFEFLNDLHICEGLVSDNSFAYWQEAVNGPD